MSEEARKESAKLLAMQISRIAKNEEVIVTGDFNSSESGESYKLLTSPSSVYPLADTRKLAGIKGTGPTYSFIGFPFRPGEEGIIDFIFISRSSSLKVIENKVIEDNEGGKYPSDHLPVITIFEF
jgi:endonuclease/exonuclease/phosphatase family metal-dependent hydrolase